MIIIIYIGIGFSIATAIAWTAYKWIRARQVTKAYRDYMRRMADPREYEAFWERAEQKSTRDPNIGRVELVWHKQEEGNQ